MAIEHRTVHFRTDDLDEVVAEIEAIADRATGDEWVTIGPWVDPEHLPVVSLLRRMFTARGPQVPEVTWVPAQAKEPAQVGIIHATGPNAHGRLHEAAVIEPEGWKVISDHSKRGLLFGIAPTVGARTVVNYSVAAAAELAMVPTDDRWIAEVSTSRR